MIRMIINKSGFDATGLLDDKIDQVKNYYIIVPVPLDPPIYIMCVLHTWARGRCRISPPRFLAECCNRQLNQASYVFAVF